MGIGECGKDCCTCTHCTATAFELQNRWQDTFCQFSNHMKYWNNSSLIVAESQAIDKFKSRWASQARGRLMFFFYPTTLLAKFVLYCNIEVLITDLFSMQSLVQISQSYSSNGALLSLSSSGREIVNS